MADFRRHATGGERNASLASMSGDPWKAAMLGLIGALIIVVALTFRDYGMSWDEPHSASNGTFYLSWFTSGFSDHRVIDSDVQRLYGSFFNFISTIARRISPLEPWETTHLLLAIFGIVGVVFAFRLASLLGGSRAGFLTAAALTLTPAYYGHSFMNPKDLPFAVLFIASIYYLVRAYDDFPTLNRRAVISLGLAFGLSLGVRAGAIMLFGYFAVLLVLWQATQYVKRGHDSLNSMPKNVLTGAKGFLLVAVLAWAVMLIWWPYAQLSPLLNPLRAMRTLAHFTYWPETVLYRGAFVWGSKVPWHYLPTWFLITLPEFYFLGFALGLLVVLLRGRQPARIPPHHSTDIATKVAFLVFAVLFPVIVAIVMHPVLYDAQRHFLFLIPLLAVLVGVGVSSFFEILPGWPTTAAAAALAVSAVLTIVDMVRLHPYQYVYFNRSFGGLPAALGRYETDYWGLSYKEGTDWLVRHYEPRADSVPVRVANTSIRELTSYYLDRYPSRFQSVEPTDNPDVVLATTRWDRHLKYPGRPLYVVKRLGIPLLYVIEVKSRSEKRRFWAEQRSDLILPGLDSFTLHPRTHAGSLKQNCKASNH